MTKIVDFPGKSQDPGDETLNAQEHARYIAEQLGEREWVCVVFGGEDANGDILLSGTMDNAVGVMDLTTYILQDVVETAAKRLPQAKLEAAKSRYMVKTYWEAMVDAFAIMRQRRPDDYELQGIMARAMEQLDAPAEEDDDAPPQ